MGLAGAGVNFVLGFAYRTFFIWVLGAAYLGINGLFSSIVSVLSLAELGVTQAIIYRFYKPINEDDVSKVGQILVFYKWVYRLIALVIFLGGCALIPFLDAFIADKSNIPDDINIQLVYLLLLLQSVASYLYSYRLTILGADQRGYTYSAIQIAVTVAKYLSQGLTLLLTGDFTLTLAAGIASNLLLNIVFSFWVTTQYRDVFRVKAILPRNERRQIYYDTFASFCHKIGDVVLRSTDNIVISSFVSIVTVGLYSNYLLLIDCARTLIKTAFNSFISSIGNAHVSQTPESNYLTYRRIAFLCSFAVGVSAVCLYALMNDFITIWIGEGYLLDDCFVAILCVSFYIELNRSVIGAFTTASGLFVKDKARPFIESAINLISSIFLVLHMGLTGVVLGTVLAVLVTAFWREPYILHKYEFCASSKGYWVRYAQFALLTLLLCLCIALVKQLIGFQASLLSWLAEAAICLVVSVFVFAVSFRKCDEYNYFKKYLFGLLRHNKG